MKRHNLVQRINAEHNTMEELGYAVETLELTKEIIIKVLARSSSKVEDILPEFTEASRLRKSEWLESARSLLDSRKLVYLSSLQREVTLNEELKQEQLRYYEERIDESALAQRRALTRIRTAEDARELLGDLSVNFAEKLRQYQAILDTKSQNIILLEKKDDRGDWGEGAGARQRPKKSFYLGEDEDEEEEEDEVQANSLGSLETLPEGEEEEVDPAARGDDGYGYGVEYEDEDEDEEDDDDNEDDEDEDDDDEQDEEDVYRSFASPIHSRETSSHYDPAPPSGLFENPRYKLDIERSLSPRHYGKLKDQLKNFSAKKEAIVEQAKKGGHQEEEEDDVVGLYWACERALPNWVYQVLILTRPENRRELVNASSTAESYCGPLHAACRQGHPLTVKILLSFGADPTLISSEGLSPLHYAAESGCLELVSILLATAKGDAAKTAQLLEGTMAGKTGYTPLTIAALKGDIPLAKELLTRAENLPSHLGKKLTQRLLKTACTLESQGLRGTPLEIATLYGHREMVLFLLSQGADPLLKEVDYTMALPTRLPYVTLDVAAR